MTPAERFWNKVDRTDGCWLWRGAKNDGGYGQLRVSHPHRRLVYAHRFAYELLVGPIPDGLTIDHLCRNRACVNPDHLEPVTPRVNLLRGTAPAAANAVRLYCKRGHPLFGPNVYSPPGAPNRRACRTCKREAQRAQRQVAAEEAA